MFRKRLCEAAASILIGLLPLVAGLPERAIAEAPSDTLRVTAVAELGRTDVLHAVAAHGARVIAVGDAGLVLESVDGGRRFERRDLPGAPPLIDVCACGDGEFFFLDFRGGLWRSAVDAGGGAGEWERREIAGARSLAMTCDPAGRLLLVGEQSSILRSDDRGQNFRVLTPDAIDRLLTDVVFLDAERAGIVGEFGSYLWSDDGGSQWQAGPEIPDELYPHAVAATEGGGLVVVGNGGAIFRSGAIRSGPTSWTAESTSVESALYGVSGEGDVLVAVGERGMALYRRLDATEGSPWQPVALLRAGALPSRYLRGLVALDDGAWVAVGERAALRVERADRDAP